MNEKNYIRGILFASAGSIGWGVSGVCCQYLFMEYDLDSGWLTAVRMVLSGIALLIIAIPGEGRGILRIWTSRCDIMWLLAFALLGLLMCQYTFLGAVKYSNSATATVLQSLNVIIMAVLVAARNRKRMSAAQTAALLWLAGTYLIATGGNPGSMDISRRRAYFRYPCSRRRRHIHAAIAPHHIHSQQSACDGLGHAYRRCSPLSGFQGVGHT